MSRLLWRLLTWLEGEPSPYDFSQWNEAEDRRIEASIRASKITDGKHIKAMPSNPWPRPRSFYED